MLTTLNESFRVTQNTVSWRNKKKKYDVKYHYGNHSGSYNLSNNKINNTFNMWLEQLNSNLS